MNFQAEIENLKSFQQAMNRSEAETARAAWTATRRSLARFRNEFLKDTPANIRGRKGGNPKRDARPTAGLGPKFRWKVKPEAPPRPRGSGFSKGEHVTKLNTVEGEFFTMSPAAKYLENPQTITAKGAWMGIPIAVSGNPNTAPLRKGERKPRVRKGWRTVPQILRNHKRQYEFKFQAKVGHTIMWARRKNKAGPPFAVMLLVRRVTMTTSYLKFFDQFDQFRPGVVRRFDEEYKKALKRIAKHANKRT